MAKLVIFDCDGVLVDSELLASTTLAKLLCDHGFKTSPPGAMDQFAGRSIRQVRTIVEEAIACRLPDNFEEVARDATRAAFAQSLEPIKGTHRKLEELRHKNIALCVASNSDYGRLRHSLELVGLWKFFVPNIFTPSAVLRDKPAPDLFIHAARKMSVAKDSCLVVEDSFLGIKAASAAGMRAIGFCGGSHCTVDHRAILLEAGAYAVIDDLSLLDHYV